MKRPQHFRRHARLQGQHEAGKLAIRTYVCTQCEVRHRPKDGMCICHDVRCLAGDGKMPVQCHCGSIEFLTFPSDTEAKAYLTLRYHEKIGLISGLKRQVSVDLFAWTPAREPLKVAVAIFDFSFVRDGALIHADAKPKSGMDDLADLKFKLAAANGVQIEIITS